MTLSRSLLVLPVLLGMACTTGGGVDRALVEAGRQRRRVQPPPTAAELRLEVDSFLDNELPLFHQKIDRRFEKERKLWRFTFVAGTALGVVAATSGTVSDSDGGAQPILTGVGVVAAIAGGVAYAVRTPELRACRAFLEGARQDVVSWRRNGIPPGDGTVSRAVWQEWVDRLAAIRGDVRCRSVR
ncbi:MAG: hypothetical protein HY900_30085 [Deltaproteobacteria bacterium]|nr:hypothetical protein [Deltaproteobacteria bacterium]